MSRPAREKAVALTRIEEAQHATKRALVTTLRNLAFQYFAPVIAEIPRPLSDRKWDLTNPDDAAECYSLAENGANLSPRQKKAVTLLCVCTLAVKDDVSDNVLDLILLDLILSAHGGRDVDDAIKGAGAHRGWAKGGFKGSAAKKEKAAKWQSNIELEVKRMLRAGKSGSAIAAQLASKTGPEELSVRSVETVRPFVAKVKRAMLKK